MKDVWVLILAAGESKRCPPNKLLLPWGKSILLEQVVDTFVRSRATATMVVLGHEANEAGKLLAGKSCSVVFNPDYRGGMGTSVARGVGWWLERMSPGPDAGLMLALGDEPLVTTAVVNRLIGGFQKSKRGIIVPVHQGRRGHPTIFHRRYAEALIEAASRGGAREVQRRHPDDVLEIEMVAEAILLDIDTPEDYDSLRSRA